MNHVTEIGITWLLEPYFLCYIKNKSICGNRMKRYNEIQANIKVDTKKSYAIVLASRLPWKRNLVLLDSMRGKIDAIYGQKRLRTLYAGGTFIEYIGYERNGLFFLSFIDPLKKPQRWVCSDIGFMQHVLELCTTYIPYGQGQDVFQLLLHWYSNESVEKNKVAFVKKLIVFRLLFLCGIHPDEEAYDPDLIALILSSEDGMVHNKKDLERRLEQWIVGSLHHVGAYDQLKTCAFVEWLGVTV